MRSTLGIAGSILLAAILIVGVLTLSRGGSDVVADEPELDHAHGLAVDVGNPDRLLIATHHGLLQLVNESSLSRVGNGTDDLMGFTVHPTDAMTFFSSGHPARGGNLGFQKSTDGGATWQKVSNGINGPVDFHAMTISRVNPDIVYGYFGNLQRSTDGGKTWEVAKGTVQPISLTTDPKRESVVYAATKNGMMVSEDMGDSWKNLSPSLEGGAVSTIAFDLSGEYALAYSLKLRGMGKSTDGGIAWQKISESFGGEAVLYIAFSASDPRIYALTESNAIYRSTDKGDSWSKVR